MEKRKFAAEAVTHIKAINPFSQQRRGPIKEPPSTTNHLVALAVSESLQESADNSNQQKVGT